MISISSVIRFKMIFIILLILTSVSLKAQYISITVNPNFLPSDTVQFSAYVSNYTLNTATVRLYQIENVKNFFREIVENNIKQEDYVKVLNKYLKEINSQKHKLPMDQYRYHFFNSFFEPLKKSGIYLLTVECGNLFNLDLINVSQLGWVIKNGENDFLAFISNRITSEPLSAGIIIYKSDKNHLEKKTDSKGIIYFKQKERNISEKSVFLIESNNEFAVVREFSENTQVGEKYKVYTYTNNPVYRPGYDVKFKSIIRKLEGISLSVPENMEINVKVTDPNNDQVWKSVLKTNKFGSLDGSFSLAGNAKPGQYVITLTADGLTSNSVFTVEEYKKPEYKVEVSTNKSQYNYSDSITAIISANYYFGSPVKNAKVIYEVYKSEFYRPWWYYLDYSWIYRHYFWDFYRREKTRILIEEGEINDKGTFTFSFKPDENDKENYEYTIVATVTDQSRREISGSKKILVTKGEYQLSSFPLKYLYKPGEKIVIQVRATDFADKPVKTKFKTFIRKTYRENSGEYITDLDTIQGETKSDGIGYITWKTEENGIYSYLITSLDSKKNYISAKGNFWVSDRGKYYWNSDGIQIISDKDVYKKGDTLNALIISPVENAKTLLTLESSEIIEHSVFNIEGFSTEYRLILNRDLPSIVNLKISFFFNNEFFSGEKRIAIIPEDKYLSVTFKTDKAHYKPGEKGKYEVKVFDKNKKPVKNCEVSVSVTDESIFAIKEDESPDIKNYFFEPGSAYIVTYQTQTGQYNPYYYDYEEYTDEHKEYGDLDLKGNNIIKGRILNENDGKPLDDVLIYLRTKNKQAETSSGLLGEFKFRKVPDGVYDLVISVQRYFYRRPYRGMTRNYIIKNIKVENSTELELGDIFVDYGVSHYPGVVYKSDVDIMRMDEAVAAPNMEVKAVNGAGMDQTKFVEPKMRTDFRDAIYWNPTLITDENGIAVFNVSFPDNLTTWRTTLKLNTQDSKFGQDTNKIIVRKDVIIRLETPRVIRENDKVTISSIVHNYLKNEKQVKIKLDITNARLIASSVNDRRTGKKINLKKIEDYYLINIPAGDETRVDWLLEITAPSGEVKLQGYAYTDTESDAVEMKIPIQTRGVEMVSTEILSLTSDNISKNLTIAVPDNTDIRAVKLTLNISPSVAGSVFGALDALIAYPYGCVEQTMSRFLPALIVDNTLKELKLDVKGKSVSELPKIVSAGLNRLYDFQHSDGGWGWWTNDESHPYMTAYVIYGLSLTQKLGYHVNEDVYSRGIARLIEFLNDKKLKDESQFAYLLYALSYAKLDNNIQSEFNPVKYFPKAGKKYSAYENALYSIAAYNFGLSDISKPFIANLKSQRISEGTSLYWGAEKFNYRWQEDKVQTTALAVRALIMIDPQSEYIENAVRWLMIQRRGNYWNSTLQTALTVFALSEYLKITNELSADFNTVIKVNGNNVLTKNFSQADLFLKETRITIDPSLLKKGNNLIEIIKNGSGKLYFSSILTYYSRELLNTPIENVFSIQRNYYLLTKTERKGEIINKLSKFNGEVKPGDEIFVKIKLKSKNSHEFFMLEEPLPAGFEVVKESDNYKIYGEKNYEYDRPYWNWFYADRDIHDDRITFFVTNLAKDTFEFSYIIKAQIPGEYIILPAVGSLMYYPEVRGTSEAEFISVIEK